MQFIREVAAGVMEAPGMAPAQELAKLRKKFDIWRREFKVCGARLGSACASSVVGPWDPWGLWVCDDCARS